MNVFAFSPIGIWKVRQNKLNFTWPRVEIICRTRVDITFINDPDKEFRGEVLARWHNNLKWSLGVGSNPKIGLHFPPFSLPLNSWQLYKDHINVCFDLLLNVTCNDISVIYVTSHRYAGGTKKKFDLRSGSQHHRHFVGFFNVLVQAPTRGHLFI